MITNFDNSWQALIKPELATAYFRFSCPPITIETQYNSANALWLAEFSRLIYRQSENAQHPDRQTFLKQANFQEIGFCQIEG